MSNSSATMKPRVLLLGWDAADWKVITPLLEAGKMPYLEKLINGGVMGNIATLRPVLSPMLWTSIATGKHADKHGIAGFVEPKADASGVQPVRSTSRTCKAIWNILSEQGLRASTVGWFASHPAEHINGIAVSNLVEQAQGKDFENWPLPDGSVQPESLREVIRDLRVHPTEIGPEQILSIVDRAGEVDQENDRRLTTVAKLLADFQTIHSIGTYIAEHEQWDLLAVYYDSIDHFGHAFMQYRAPQMPHVDDKDFELYQHVIDRCYQLHDLSIGRYMRLVGPETTIVIVSDHGFHSDHLRPPDGTSVLGEGLVHQHRDYGILVACGPGIKKDERVYGATLLDITPTILTMLDLPVGRDMDGNVLSQLFESDRDISMIDTYERSDEERDTKDIEVEEDPWAAQAAIQQLAALGYVEEPDEDAARAIERVTAQRLANLGQVHFTKGNYAEAERLLEESMQYEVFPSAKRRLAMCYLHLGKLDECKTLADEMLADQEDTPYSNMLRGYLLYLEHKDDEALAVLKQVEENNLTRPQLFDYLGLIYLRRKQWEDARQVFSKAVDVDEEKASSIHGLGLALYHLGRHEEAVEQLMRSVSLLHHQPKAHYHLGLALAAVGQLDWAIRALHVAIDLQPGWKLAHQHLAMVYRARGDHASAQLHAGLAGQLAEKDFGASFESRPQEDTP